MANGAPEELDNITGSDASEEFKAPQEPGVPVLIRNCRRSAGGRRIRFWEGSSSNHVMSHARICPVCEVSPVQKKKKGCHHGPWANGLCYQHALESGCQPPAAKVCRECQEIARKEEAEATDKGSLLVRTKLKLAQSGWAHGLCSRHAVEAGLSRKKKLFDNNALGDAGKKQKKLPFLIVLPEKSQSQMAEDGSIEEKSDGSIEPPPEPRASLHQQKYPRAACGAHGFSMAASSAR